MLRVSPILKLFFLIFFVCLKSGLKAQSEQELEAQVINIFVSTCAKAGCHIGPNSQMGMELSRENFYASIVDEPSTENPNLKRVNPGNPELSYMIKKVKRCSGYNWYANANDGRNLRARNFNYRKLDKKY